MFSQDGAGEVISTHVHPALGKGLGDIMSLPGLPQSYEKPFGKLRSFPET